jgi:hypothetical protein
MDDLAVGVVEEIEDFNTDAHGCTREAEVGKPKAENSRDEIVVTD